MGHAEQEVAEKDALNVPAGHGSQAAAPLEAAYWPGMHGAHPGVTPSEEEPAAQAAHWLLSASQ